jgi:hypothetical protein
VGINFKKFAAIHKTTRITGWSYKGIDSSVAGDTYN